MMSAEPGAIPIRNVYALLSYAWDFLELSPLKDVGAIDADTPADLLARLLTDGLQALLRRGPYRAYVEYTDDLRNPRGAIDVSRTVTSALRARGLIGCRLTDLSYDVIENRIIKATARLLFACRDIDKPLSLALRDVYLRMSEVADVELTVDLLRRARVPRGHRLYGMLFKLCQLVLENLLPEEHGAGFRLRDFTRDEAQMAHLFEEFVRGFLQRHIDDACVQREHLDWVGASGPPEAVGLLPRMQTDTCVRTKGHCTVIETKFVRRPFRQIEDSARLKLRSEHIYQLFAYLKNTRARGPAPLSVDGILLYAGIGHGVSETLALGDSRVSIRTLDLTASWADIRAALLALPVRRSAVRLTVA